MPALIRSFLVATDGSEPAGRAIEVAATMAQAAGGILKVIAVAMPLTRREEEEFRRVEGALADPSEAFGEQILAQARTRLEQGGMKRPATLLRWGDPAEAIIATIIEEKVDAVVVGRRGRGRLSGLLLGSVSQKLVCLAPCTVIVVP